MRIIGNFFRYLINFLLFIVLVFLPIAIILSIKWFSYYYGALTIDEIIFHLISPLEGVNKSIALSYIKLSLIPTIVISLLLLSLFIINNHFFKDNKLYIRINFFKIKMRIRYYRIITLTMVLVCLSFLLYKSINSLNIKEYIKNQKDISTFIEDNYIDPKEVNLNFPDNKRNLIYIFVESYESTYFSKKLGGYDSLNYMEPITELTKNNIHFSNNDSFGGAVQTYGTQWTSRGMLAQTAGLPLKIAGGIFNNGNLNDLANGAYSIGEILNKEGYNQELLLSSDGDFGNRKVYFKKHGNYNVVDYYNAIKKGWIDKDYEVWWGYEDSKLFEFAQKEILSLADKKEPFNFTMLTTNTHFPGGYLEEDCELKYDDQIENVISCTSKQLKEFVEWIKKQSFYKNTTIVISGDHLSMEPEYFDNLDESYERTIYDLFINSAIKTTNTKNRTFSTLDLYPTTLASLGVKIEGDRLALGTNLFSDRQTLLEEYGKENVYNELFKRSIFYENKIQNGTIDKQG